MSELNLADFAAFAFDFDGTLADSVATHNQARVMAFAQMAEETGKEGFLRITPEIQAEAHRHGSNPHSIIGWAHVAAGIVEDIGDPLVARAVELKKKSYLDLCRGGLDEIPFSTTFLRKVLDGTQKPGAITTTAHREEVMPFIERYQIGSLLYGSNIVTAEDIDPSRMKPDPLAYEITLERLGIGVAHKLLVFEDTPGGIQSAKAAGATAVAVCTTHASKSFEGAGADYVFANFEQLLDISK